MPILNRMTKKNKQSEHYQRKYEELSVDGDGITIGMGSEGLVRGRQEEKEQYYNEVRNKITSKDKEKIKRIAQSSRTIYEIFSKMERERMPLDYLVALDLVEEIDIESYQNVKVKGLEAGRTMTGEELTEVDETLQMQVMSQGKEMPELRDALTEEEMKEIGREKPVDEYQQMVEEYQNSEQREEESEKEPEEVVEETIYEEEQEEHNGEKGYIEEEYVEQEEEYVEDEEGYVEQEEQSGEKGYIEEEYVEEDNDEEEEISEIDKLRQLKEQFRKRSEKEQEEQLEQEREEEEKRREKEEQRRLKNIRNVYIIGSNLLLPVMEEYRVIEVKGMAEILEYTSSKRNLLVITQNIPTNLQKDLMEWLVGISNSSSKYRIVTATGSAVGHPLIEATVDLSKESFDEYFETHKDENYDGKDVEGFFDISSFLE